MSDGAGGGESDEVPRAETINQAGEIRSASLESLRALAALGVLVGHIFGQSRHYATQATLDSFLHRTLLGGGYGVFLFFGLTGYLLFWPFARRQFGDAVAIDLRRYAINRMLRILPLYLTAVVVLMVLQQHGGSFGQWWRFLTFSQNFSTRTVGTVDGPMWSLVVEIHFYLLLPLLAVGLAGLARGSRARAAAVLLVLGALSYIAREHAIGGPERRILLEYSLPATFMYFVPGMLLALLRSQWERRRPGWLHGVLAHGDLWLLAAVGLTLLQFRDYGNLVLIAFAAFFAIGACVLPLRRGRLVRALGWRPLAAIGVASYSLYVWHDPIVTRLAALHGIPRGFAAQLVIAGVVSVAVALISYRVVEAPFLRLRRRWSSAGPGDRGAVPGPAPAPRPRAPAAATHP